MLIGARRANILTSALLLQKQLTSLLPPAWGKRKSWKKFQQIRPSFSRTRISSHPSIPGWLSPPGCGQRHGTSNFDGLTRRLACAPFSLPGQPPGGFPYSEHSPYHTSLLAPSPRNSTSLRLLRAPFFFRPCGPWPPVRGPCGPIFRICVSFFGFFCINTGYL